MKKCLAFILILTLVLCACSKTEYLNRVEKEGGSGFVMESYTDETMTTLTGFESYDADGNLQIKVAHSFDKNGNRTETVQYDKDLNVEQTISYTYDENGNNTVVSWKDQNGKETNRREMDYAADGVITESRTYRGDWLESKTEFETDGTETEYGARDCITTEYLADGTISGYSTNEYDQSGYQTYKEYTPDWVIQYCRQYTPDGAVETHYDENGNVVE